MRFLLCLTIFIAQGAFSQESPNKAVSTNPRPPEALAPRWQHPADDIASDIDKRNWRIVGANPGETAVPVWDFSTTVKLRMGSLPVGTPIKLDHFRKVGKQLYYAVTMPEGIDGKKGVGFQHIGWVCGIFIEPADEASKAPPPETKTVKKKAPAQ